MAKHANGSGTDVFGGGLNDGTDMWTLSTAAAVSGVRGSAVNKSGVDTAFPQNRCSQLFFRDNVIYGKKIKGGWYYWNGSTWVINNDPRDYG